MSKLSKIMEIQKLLEWDEDLSTHELLYAQKQVDKQVDELRKKVDARIKKYESWLKEPDVGKLDAQVLKENIRQWKAAANLLSRFKADIEAKISNVAKVVDVLNKDYKY